MYCLLNKCVLEIPFFHSLICSLTWCEMLLLMQLFDREFSSVKLRLLVGQQFLDDWHRFTSRQPTLEHKRLLKLAHSLLSCFRPVRKTKQLRYVAYEGANNLENAVPLHYHYPITQCTAGPNKPSNPNGRHLLECNTAPYAWPILTEQ